MDQYIGMITATVAVCAAAAAAGAAMCRSAKKREEGTVIHGRSFCAMCCSGAVGAAAFALTVITGFIPGVGFTASAIPLAVGLAFCVLYIYLLVNDASVSIEDDTVTFRVRYSVSEAHTLSDIRTAEQNSAGDLRVVFGSGKELTLKHLADASALIGSAGALREKKLGCH